ncbi:hypothetical protein [Oceanimonas sp. MB9]|uniref:hypothetical protein n=1 Tax=Oceanimonas sp. MB9 TaxID=2588453 RepID=UPI0013F60B7A|nr:hypothetical protein [Oceanimonas sp. MB9]
MRKQTLPAVALLSLFAMGAAHADGIDRHEKRMAELRASQAEKAQFTAVQSGQELSSQHLQNGTDGIDRHEKRMEELRKARG